MIRYALRRILWAIPSLFATSFVLFFLTTLAPDPASPRNEEEAYAPASDPLVQEARRSRFLDLPRFVNARPQDVRSRASAAIIHVAAADGAAEGSVRELQSMGGAALPYVLPALEALAPDARGRVAVALAPIAERMRLAATDELRRPEAATSFWTRFWDDRALDFTATAVDRAVARLVEHGTALREADLIALDTFALPELIGAMSPTQDRVSLERLARIACHATGRGVWIPADATPDSVRRAVADWREWWFVHATDYVALEGADRAIAVIAETRYGKWLKRATSGELGVSAMDGEPVASKLREHAPLTMLVCLLAIFASWTVAVPLGALGAWRQGHAFDVTSSAVLFLLYATPTFAAAELLRRATAHEGSEGARVVLAVIALSMGSLATLSRWQRTAMLEVVRQDFVRTAVSKGMPPWRVAVVHALRNALLPTVTLAGLHLPVLFGGAFVVEEVFALPGLGFQTLRAIEAHDTAWLMAIVLVAAVAVTVGLVASDVGYGALDPRVRELLTRRHGGRAA